MLLYIHLPARAIHVLTRNHSTTNVTDTTNLCDDHQYKSSMTVFISKRSYLFGSLRNFQVRVILVVQVSET